MNKNIIKTHYILLTANIVTILFVLKALWLSFLLVVEMYWTLASTIAIQSFTVLHLPKLKMKKGSIYLTFV